jgi:signal transduction histidine kinase
MPAGHDEELTEIAAGLVPLATDGCTIDLFESSGVVCVAASHIDGEAERELFDFEKRRRHTALSRCSITMDDETVGEVVAWGSRTLSPLAEALVCSAAGHAGAVIDARRARRRALEAEAGRASIVAMVGHEVRAPLQALTVGLDLVQMRVRGAPAGLSPEWLDERCARLSRSLHRLRDVAKRLLDVARLEGADAHVEPADEELGNIVAAVVARVREEAEWAGCSIEVVDDGSQKGRWDRLHLETIVENLLANAMKYGAGERIDVRLDGGPHDVRISVRDHGCGVVEGDVAHVFDRFFRGTVPGHYPGLGVGLWIVKKLVDAHGGTVTCESTLGSGSTFTVTLPRDVTRADRVRGPVGWPREAPRR